MLKPIIYGLAVIRNITAIPILMKKDKKLIGVAVVLICFI